MGAEFVTLFTEMGVIPAVLLTIGIVLCVIEMFIPGVGICGISGSIAIILGIIFRMVNGGSLTQFFIMIFIAVALFTVIWLIILKSAKKGLLSKSALINNSTAVPTDYKDESLLKLVGKQGITITECKPSGKVEINNTVYEVISSSEFLLKGIKVEVISINDSKIMVKQI